MLTLSFWLTANILREKSSGGNSVTLNAGSSVLNKKKNGFTVWKGSSDCSDVLYVVLETVLIVPLQERWH